MPLSLSAIDAAYSAAQELGFWSHQVLIAARKRDLPAELPDGRRVPLGSRFLAELARNVNLEATRVTHAKRILDVSDAILAANLSRGEYRIGEIVEATAHKAVLSYAQELAKTAWNCQARRMRVGAAGPQNNDPDWPTTWTAAVWPTIRSVFAAQSIPDWNAVRVALEREHAAAALPRDQGGAGQGEGDSEQVTKWLKVSEAAKAAACNSGIISKAVDSGALKGNGKKKRARRIDAADFARWLLERADRPEPEESDAAVRRKVKKHVTDS